MAEPRKLIIHMGAPKTGSTSIQHHLHENAAVLAPAISVYTPRSDSGPAESCRAAIAYSLSPNERTEKALKAALARLRTRIEAMPGHCIVSLENLAGATPGRGSERGLFSRIGDIARCIQEAFDGFDIRFVLYTRDIEKWKASAYGQVVRSDGYAGDRETYLAEIAGITGWQEMLDRMEAAVGKDRLVVLSMEQDIDATYPSAALLSLVGFGAESLPSLKPMDKRRNEQLNQGQQEFLRRLNAAALPSEAMKKLRRLVASHGRFFADTVAAEDSAGKVKGRKAKTGAKPAVGRKKKKGPRAAKPAALGSDLA